MFFLNHCSQSPFRYGESQSTSHPSDALQLCADLDLLWGQLGF